MFSVFSAFSAGRFSAYYAVRAFNLFASCEASTEGLTWEALPAYRPRRIVPAESRAPIYFPKSISGRGLAGEVF
jgi:hypothetical protein